MWQNLALFKYFKEVNSELKKVSWPSRELTLQQTLLVIAACLVVGAYLGIIDFGLTRVLELVLANK